MSDEQVKMEDLLEEMFDALTNYDCHTRQEIADAMSRSHSQVDAALLFIRDPEHQDEYGWTVPHAERGNNNESRIYRIVATDGGVLDEDELRDVRNGLRGTLSETARKNSNEANAIRMAAKQLGRGDKRRLNQVADALMGAAGMAQAEADRLIAVKKQEQQELFNGS